MNGKLYIKKFIRDDGETLSFDAEEIYLSEDNTLLVRSDPATTAVDFTEADGGEMIRQRGAVYHQTVKGLIVPKTSDYWSLCTRLSRFFVFNHTYKIVYVKVNGSMFATNGAWISSGLQIVPVPHENYSYWNIEFAIGNIYWAQYAENSEGKQIYSNSITLPLITASMGGELWATGAGEGEVWDNVGGVWEAGSGGVQTISVDSTQKIYPVWTVTGPCVNPVLQNNTTDTFASFDGTVAAGQTLTVYFEDGIAYLDSAIATRYVSGYVSFLPGENMVGFNSDGGSAESSTISWDNIIN